MTLPKFEEQEIEPGRLHAEARQHEAAGRYGPALEAYLQAARARRDGEADEIPLLLYLNVADLLHRMGRRELAERAYDRVRDRYARAGETEKAEGLERLTDALYGGTGNGGERPDSDSEDAEGSPAGGA